jgi:hypothetical protein
LASARITGRGQEREKEVEEEEDLREEKGDKEAKVNFMFC